MIDEEVTFREKGYRSADLKPRSNKSVYRTCDICGEGKWLVFNGHSDLCDSCSRKTRFNRKCSDIDGVTRNIDEEKTLAEKGYASSELRPKSNKHVYRVCVECGNGKWIAFSQYSDLCHKCACNTEEYRKNQSDSHIGHEVSDEARLKIGIASMRENRSEETLEKMRISSLRENLSEETLLKRSKAAKERIASPKARANMSKSKIGKNNPNWKGGISSEDHIFRQLAKYRDWRVSVFERDDYTCQECEIRGGVLNAHHILQLCDYKDECYSLNIDNGITLCEDCHRETYNREYEFVERYQEIINVNKRMIY